MAGVSERKRNRVIARLQRGYASGALSTQTFERRLDCALRADSGERLRQATHSVLQLTLLERLRTHLSPAPAARASSGLLVSLAAEQPTVIGRSSSCDVVLRNDSVSRRHAMIVRHGQRYFLTDLGSTNATYVNGRQVAHCEVLPGDRLQLGDISLTL
jgi:pSer/pThr/pTyr-binding forkhead associated (FHA) protein